MNDACATPILCQPPTIPCAPPTTIPPSLPLSRLASRRSRACAPPAVWAFGVPTPAGYPGDGYRMVSTQAAPTAPAGAMRRYFAARSNDGEVRDGGRSGLRGGGSCSRTSRCISIPGAAGTTANTRDAASRHCRARGVRAQRTSSRRHARPSRVRGPSASPHPRPQGRGAVRGINRASPRRASHPRRGPGSWRRRSRVRSRRRRRTARIRNRPCIPALPPPGAAPLPGSDRRPPRRSRHAG